MFVRTVKLLRENTKDANAITKIIIIYTFLGVALFTQVFTDPVKIKEIIKSEQAYL